LQNTGHNKVSWCSWLSRQSNTLKVSGSNPGDAKIFPSFLFFTSQKSERNKEIKPSLWVAASDGLLVITQKTRFRISFLLFLPRRSPARPKTAFSVAGLALLSSFFSYSGSFLADSKKWVS
jgi:hypothetical protein